MTFFWILWGFDALISLVILYFFFIGLSDGSVSSTNMGMWMVILLILAVIMGGSVLLKNSHMALAKLVLWIMAMPGLLYGIFILFAVIAKPRWN